MNCRRKGKWLQERENGSRFITQECKEWYKVCKQASNTKRDSINSRTQTFTINGDFPVYYKLEEKGREKVERESGSRSKLVARLQKSCDYKSTGGYL